MGDNSAISWTDASWNPIRSRYLSDHAVPMVQWGCLRVSPGCDNCYASTLHVNHGGAAYEHEGLPLYTRQLRGGLQLHEPTLLAPLKWRRPRKIFLSSMTDIFGDWVDDAWLDRVFAVMAGAPQHTFQVLTKRAHRMFDYVTTPRRDHAISQHVCGQQMKARCPAYGCSEDREMDGFEWPLPNVWLGVTVESQDYAWRLNYLCETSAVVHWVSAEPLLGPLTLVHAGQSYPDWIVVGGESGANFRPMNPEWARSLRDESQTYGAAFFYKQHSGPRPAKHPELDGQVWEQYPEVAA